ncbi:MAG: NnrS family protein [bacterium]|nr:NnrS family protein [bacterium]
MKINRIFVPLLLIMAIANLLTHLQFLGISDTYSRGTDAMLYMIILLIVFIGGRVMPFFTESVLPDAKVKRNQPVETASAGALIALVLVQMIYPTPWLSGPLAALVAVTQILRVIGWHDRRVWSTPILWVLYAGMLWIILGFTLKALAAAGMVSTTLATHALTVGGIGVLTLGMICRVALGHTGRPMQPATSIKLSFILLNIGAAVRVLAPIFMPGQYQLWVHLSGGIWILCFVIFCAVYLPILVKPRADGKEG